MTEVREAFSFSHRSILELSPSRARALAEAMRAMPAANLSLAAKQALNAIPVDHVRLGTKGGLPFEFLATDLYAGCLPLKSLCYGNCSQGLLALEQG